MSKNDNNTATQTTGSKAIATFTLAVREPDSHTLAIATASNFLAVGSLVPWIDSQAGLVVSQSFANPNAAGAALESLRHGDSAEQALQAFLADDAMAKQRQVGILTQQGECQLYTGPDCVPAMESIQGESVQGEDYFVLGNMLKPGTCEAIAQAFSASRRDGFDLGDAMLKAMIAGQQAGGDKRGKLAAALIIKRQNAGYLASSDTFVDLRVDAHPRPLSQLRDLYSLFKLYNPQHFNAHMIKLEQLKPHQWQLLYEVIQALVAGATTTDDPQAIADILQAHNLGANFDAGNQRVSELLLQEAHALLRLLTPPL
ncbi:MAG: DUF1028 domain-containing protein [Gammaproteobacteria bacterium]|nr:DUF1028 domain-containing protein [Gammaproteobacteria bacterium]